MFASLGVVAVISGTLTLLAELIRAVPMTTVEVFALIMMRRIHRGRTAAFEFGSGKLEQFVNLVIAGGFILGGIWILRNVLALVTGSPADRDPIRLCGRRRPLRGDQHLPECPRVG